MKQITGARLAREIEDRCRKDLDRIEQGDGTVGLGIPSKILIFMTIRAAEGRLEFFTAEIKEAFRNRAMEYSVGEARAAKLMQSIDNLRNKGSAIERLPVPLQPQAWRDSRKKLGEYLREHGYANHDQAIPLIVNVVLTYSPRFDCWMELARVLHVAYIASGRVADPDDAKTDTLYTALLRAASSYRTGVAR